MRYSWNLINDGSQEFRNPPDRASSWIYCNASVVVFACACSQKVILKEKHQQWQKWWKSLKVWLVGRWLWRFYVGICCIFSQLNRQRILGQNDSCFFSHKAWINAVCIVSSYVIHQCFLRFIEAEEITQWSSNGVMESYKLLGAGCAHLYARHKIGVWCECVRTG